ADFLPIDRTAGRDDRGDLAGGIRLVDTPRGAIKAAGEYHLRLVVDGRPARIGERLAIAGLHVRSREEDPLLRRQVIHVDRRVITAVRAGTAILERDLALIIDVSQHAADRGRTIPVGATAGRRIARSSDDRVRARRTVE